MKYGYYQLWVDELLVLWVDELWVLWVHMNYDESHDMIHILYKSRLHLSLV